LIDETTENFEICFLDHQKTKRAVPLEGESAGF